MNWWMIFSAGVLAGATTCAATQGGLLVGLIARNSDNKSRDARSLSEDAVPVSGFLVGKLKNTTASAPFLLGLSTVAIPCGVTISIELIAATSGSPITGAAVMSLFVIGTAPMFAVFGVAAARYRDRLKSANFVLGAVVVALALFTVNSGLVALGSPVSFQTLMGGSVPTPTKSATVNDGDTQVIDMDGAGVDGIQVCSRRNALRFLSAAHR